MSSLSFKLSEAATCLRPQFPIPAHAVAQLVATLRYKPEGVTVMFH